MVTIIDRFCKCQMLGAHCFSLTFGGRPLMASETLASISYLQGRPPLLPPKASLEWLWVPEVVLYIIQAPLLPGHHTSRHAPHWMQQTTNLLDTLDRPTGPRVVYSNISLRYTNVPSHRLLRLQGYTSLTGLYKLVY